VTVEQAIGVLEQVRQRFQGTGQDHDILKQAIETLAKNVAPTPTLKLNEAEIVE
jgi:hypothetical protein